MEPKRNRYLAELAVETTGLGNVPDKIIKNHRKTLGVMSDIKEAVTYGILSDNPATGITEIARPKGIVGAIVPSTNPARRQLLGHYQCHQMRNAGLQVAPSPKGTACCEKLIDYIQCEFKKVGEDPDLVQMVPAPVSKEKAQALMDYCDMIVCTGSQNNVNRAHRPPALPKLLLARAM